MIWLCSLTSHFCFSIESRLYGGQAWKQGNQFGVYYSNSSRRLDVHGKREESRMKIFGLVNWDDVYAYISMYDL